MKIDLETAASILMDLNGAEFFGLEINTDPRMLKTGNPFIQDGIRKVSHMTAQITDYEKSVNRKRAKEGKEEDFVAKSSYHEPIIINDKLTAFARHKSNGRIYLRYRSLGCAKTEYLNRYNAVVPGALLKPFLPKKSKSEEVPFRLTCLENIQALVIKGRRYEIKND